MSNPIPSLTSATHPMSTANTSSPSSTDSIQKRAYVKPGFITSQAFERQALSCAGCLNQSASFPVFCGMRS